MSTQTAKQSQSEATTACRLIRTGNPVCQARFYPSLYQLVLIREGVEGKVDLGYSGSRLLERLLRTPGEVVAREELMSHAWSDRVVGQGSLNQQIYTLRQILSDEKSREILQTLPRRGYMFNPSFLIAPAEQVPPATGAAPRQVPTARSTLRPTAKNKRRLWLLLATGLMLLGSALLVYLYVHNQRLELFSNKVSSGHASIVYVSRSEQPLEHLTQRTQALTERMAALAKKPVELIVNRSSDYYEVLCLSAGGQVNSLKFHESQLDKIVDAQLQACLP